ncbi:MAG: FAD-dependent oxidoreductase [Verrucomicrobia bacterium]|nr:FAD-dependent oxidoreductase [Verrucomicrobiota bacterium]MCH8511818.1 FAD-dependent oxidoreductase [Kiritimatiellia bacterium]
MSFRFFSFCFLLLAVGRPSVVYGGAETPNPGLRYYYPAPDAPVVEVEADVVVYGGTSGGVVAAVQAARMGKSVALVVFGRRVGGMTSGGLTKTDGVNAAVQGGITREFFDRVGNSGFRPSTAQAAFEALLADPVPGRDPVEPIPVYYEQRLASVEMEGNRISVLHMENGSVFRGKRFIDCTYEGDLMAAAGVTYTYGREARGVYGESEAGIKRMHTLPGVNAYVMEGDPDSGLIFGVMDEPAFAPGEGDRHIQAYNFRMFTVTSDNPDQRQPIFEPEAYDASLFEMLYRYHRAGGGTRMKIGNDVNNHEYFNRGVASDHIGYNRWPASDGGWLTWGEEGAENEAAYIPWPEADYPTREKIYQSHVAWQLGMLWYLQTDERYRALATDPEVDASVRESIQGLLEVVDRLGLPPGEYPETGGWPHELYVREARRMVSDLVMHEGHYRREFVVDDPVGLANYRADSHHVRRIVGANGIVRPEGDTGGGIVAPWRISYRSIVPKRGEVDNLLVPWAISASHVAFGSMRMEPCFMVLSQSAATAASLSIDEAVAVQDLDYDLLKPRLLADGMIPGNFPVPSVRFVRPAFSSNQTPGETLELEVEAAYAENGIAKVAFFQGATLLGEVSEPPYAWTATLPSFGRISFTARATDGEGRTNQDRVFVTVGTGDELMGNPHAGLIIDNSDPDRVEFTGEWPSSSIVAGHIGDEYQHDGRTGGGKSARYTPDLPESGLYEVYIGSVANPMRATNVPVDILHAGETTTVEVNQREGGYWRFAGQYSFEIGKENAVILRNDGADSYVVADAVSFVRAPASDSD